MEDAPVPRDWDEIQALVARQQEEERQRYEAMRGHARASYRAMEGWSSVKSEDDWLRLVDEARTSYRSGRFLIERLGAERHLDPELMAVIWSLRQGIIAHYEPVTFQETMLIDLAVTSYYHALRINGWIGNFATLIEQQFFGQEGLTVTTRLRHGKYSEELQVDTYLQRVSEELMPLLDRANRMLIRNLKTINDLRRGPAATVAINTASQVNVGAQQINIADERD